MPSWPSDSVQGICSTAPPGRPGAAALSQTTTGHFRAETKRALPVDARRETPGTL
jgi:hypothetical protein